MSELTSFDISWRNGAYYVSVPNYHGGKVYTSDCVERLVKALELCAAAYSTPPGPVVQCSAEIGREFQRRMDVAGEALSRLQDAVGSSGDSGK